MLPVTADIYHDVFAGSTLNMVYAGALLIGAIYSFVLLFMNDVVEGWLHIDLNFDHHLGALDHDAGSDAIGLSMLAITSFISAFGAFGLISVTLFDANRGSSLLAALLGGLLIGFAAQLFFVYILSPTISSEVKRASLIGTTAEITTPIPAHGVGQIAFVAEGSRMTYTARATQDGEMIQRGMPVRIERIVGGVAYVRALD